MDYPVLSGCRIFQRTKFNIINVFLYMFRSWTYHGFQVDITNRSDNVDLTNYVVSGEFDLIRVHQKRRVVKYTCCPEVRNRHTQLSSLKHFSPILM